MADLKDLLLKYRKGRNGFDDLALEVSRLYAAGMLRSYRSGTTNSETYATQLIMQCA